MATPACRDHCNTGSQIRDHRCFLFACSYLFFGFIEFEPATLLYILRNRIALNKPSIVEKEILAIFMTCQWHGAGSSMVRLTFEKTSIKGSGNLSQLPPIEVPRLPDQLRPPSNTGMGEFDVTYLDADTRITRGDRGELRVFVVS